MNQEDEDNKKDAKLKARENLAQLNLAIEQSRMQLEGMVELIRGQSIYMRARFVSLVEQGFSETQALEIVKARGW